MKYTLLDLTQTILSSIDGDEVNSISDTVEAQQVSTIIRTAYYDIVSPSDLPEHYGLFNLNATSIDTPIILTRPDTVDYLEWFDYNTKSSTDTEDKWKRMEYLEPSEFLEKIRGFDQSAITTSSIDYTANGFTTKLYYENDRAPKYWTSFDDQDVVCDAYDSVMDDYLQTSKNSCYGKLLKVFTMTDNFTPDLDDQQFALLLNESKAMAWAELKQASNSRAEKLARGYKTKIERTKKDLPGKDGWQRSLPNYGRHRS